MKEESLQACRDLCFLTCRDALMAKSVGYASWLAAASFVLLHVAFCSHATVNYLILLHNVLSS